MGSWDVPGSHGVWSYAHFLQAHLHLVETVGAVAMLGLSHVTFLPDLYIDTLVSRPYCGMSRVQKIYAGSTIP